MRKINVLSLCDGMSCGQIALKELGFKIGTYYASEIDKNAIKVTQDNFPDTIQLGDVTLITPVDLMKLPKIDLVCFGSPCRSLTKTTAGREQYNNGLKGISGLFFDCNNILQWIKIYNNPNVKFLIENVVPNSSKQDDIDQMSMLLGVEPIEINSALFSAQDRKRYYWTNIDIDELPISNDTVMKDILDENVSEDYFYNRDILNLNLEKRMCCELDIKGHNIIKAVYHPDYKSPTLTACRGGNTQKKVYVNGRVRKLTENEYRKLQTIPEWYQMNVAKSHIYNMCGDGWTIEVIKFIFKNL